MSRYYDSYLMNIMKIFKTILSHILNNTSLYFFVFLAVFTIDRHHRYEATTNPDIGPFESDVAEYYSYLPDLFYNGKDKIAQNVVNNKRTIGMAIMYAPAFFVGEIIAKHTGEEINGYSKPYQWSIRWGSILICIAGLLLCRKSLLLFFSDTIVLISLSSILFGTNLFYYTFSNGEMPHCYLFFLYSAFIYFTLKLILENKYRNLLWMGLIGGIITLIRPTDVIILFLPLILKVNSIKDLKERIIYFFKHPYFLFFTFVLFLIPIVMQMFVWKQFIGSYIYYSYNNERFFFNDPQIINFLFSYRKGWLVYTPIMLFSLIGIILSKKYLKDFFTFLIIYTLLTFYILSSWWDWAYGGSYGCRALIQSYAILIFPFAVFISWCFKAFKKRKVWRFVLRTLLLCILFLIIKLNLFQIWQYKYLIIHWSGMNKEYYKYVFLKKSLTHEELLYVHSIATPPDPDKMMKGDRD